MSTVTFPIAVTPAAFVAFTTMVQLDPSAPHPRERSMRSRIADKQDQNQCHPPHWELTYGLKI